MQNFSKFLKSFKDDLDEEEEEEVAPAGMAGVTAEEESNEFAVLPLTPLKAPSPAGRTSDANTHTHSGANNAAMLESRSSSSFGSPGGGNDMTFMTANSGLDAPGSGSSKYVKYAVVDTRGASGSASGRGGGAAGAAASRSFPLAAKEDFDFETSLGASTTRFPTSVAATSATRKKEQNKKGGPNLSSKPAARQVARYDDDEDLVFS